MPAIKRPAACVANAGEENSSDFDSTSSTSSSSCPFTCSLGAISEGSNDADVHAESEHASGQEKPLEEQPIPKSQKLHCEDDTDLLFLTQEVQAANNAGESMKATSCATGPPFEELYNWPDRYAGILLSDETAKCCALSLQGAEFIHHEAFAGTGGAGISLHMVHTLLRRQLMSGMSSSQSGGQPSANHRMLFVYPISF